MHRPLKSQNENENHFKSKYITPSEKYVRFAKVFFIELSCYIVFIAEKTYNEYIGLSDQ